MRYSDADKERMLGYPILSLLSVNGKRTDRRGPLHFSPFRDEKVGSFKIDVQRNVWYDHGEGCGGSVFTLAQRLLGIPDSRRSEVWDYLASLDPSVTTAQPSLPHTQETPSTSRIVIDSASPALPGYMYSYARSRGIGRGILSRYCSAVTYHVEGTERRTCAIGFPSGRDGWVLRRATDRPGCRNLKRCTASCATLLGRDGTRTDSPTHEEVVVFEGFFDFLSWLEEKRTTLPFCDVCVLNSVSNTGKAMEFLLSHGRIVTLLDNDTAGREHTERIRRAAAEAGVGFRDDSPMLGSCKDVNEHLMSIRAKTISIHP